MARRKAIGGLVKKKRRKERGGTAAPVAGHLSGSDLLSYAEAAAFLGVSQGTLENWVSSGLYNIPFIKVGRLVRFRRGSLVRWLESREHNSGQSTTMTTVVGSAEAR